MKSGCCLSSLEQLVTDAVNALSPSCRVPEGDDYRASSCWQVGS
jgi:hypothetical protein